MKNKYLYIAVLFTLLGSACNKTPMFPDPGFDSRVNLSDTVRIDTISTYTISMKIDIPNGVKKLELLDGANYTVLDDLTSKYVNQEEFIFTYDIDISNVTEEVKKSYIVRVVDNSNRAINRALLLVVKPKSTPTVFFPTDDDYINITSRVFDLNLVFETGLYNIKEYKIYFEGELIDEENLEDQEINIFNLKLPINQKNMIIGNTYDLKIDLTDDRDITTENILKLKLVEAKKPYLVIYNSKDGDNGEYYFHYSKVGLTDSIIIDFNDCDDYSGEYTNMKYKMTFEYNENGQITKHTRIRTDKHAYYDNIEFVYDENGLIQSITDLGSSANGDSDISVRTHNDQGLIESFREGVAPIVYTDIVYYEDVDGKLYNCEVWGANKIDKFREHNIDILPVEIPTFIPSIPTLWIESPPFEVEDLLMYKYVSLETKRTFDIWPHTATKREYSQYEDGQLKKLIIKDNFWGDYPMSREYTFLYK